MAYVIEDKLVVKALYEQHHDNAHLCTFLAVFIATFPFNRSIRIHSMTGER